VSDSVTLEQMREATGKPQRPFQTQFPFGSIERIMGKTRRKKPAARGRFRRESPKKHMVTPDFQSEIPEEQRRKYWMLQYANGYTVKKAVKKAPVGVPIRSNMQHVMPLAVYKPSPLKLDDILRQRFRIKRMNDDWRSWDEDAWIKKQIQARRKRFSDKRGKRV
jgi:hypothetical protein